VTDFSEIKTTSKNHFVELYTQKEEAIQVNITTMLEHITSMITNKENIELNHPISENEIHIAIWNLEPDKAPCLDGFSISFYRFFWELIKTNFKRMLHFPIKPCD
jgi:hypothetical protein